MTEAEKLFNEVFARWLNRQGFITSFRRTSLEGTKEAKKNIEAEHAQFVDALRKGHDYDEIFLEKESFFKETPPEKLVSQLTETTFSQAQIAVDAASIIFAHSVVDGAAFDYCRVTALVAPRDWETVLDQRQIKLSEARETSYQQVLRKKLDEFFEELERESLLRKVEHLFARCKPPAKWSPMHDYIFDRDRLRKLDDYRHEVIHGNRPMQGVSAADEEVDYLMRMVLFLQGMINLRYGLKLNPFYAFTGIELPAPTVAEAQPVGTLANKDSKKMRPCNGNGPCKDWKAASHIIEPKNVECASFENSTSCACCGKEPTYPFWFKRNAKSQLRYLCKDCALANGLCW